MRSMTEGFLATPAYSPAPLRLACGDPPPPKGRMKWAQLCLCSLFHFEREKKKGRRVGKSDAGAA